MDIYKITNTINNKAYVGFSNDAFKRFKRHLSLADQGVNRRLYDSIRKHGKENFKLEILSVCETRQEAIKLEKFWILELNTIMPSGYNMTVGGDGGNTLEKWSEEDKKLLYLRQGISRTGRKVSDETRKKISESHKGKIMTEYQKKNLSETMKRIGHKPPVIKGKIPWIAGKTHSEESRKKISDSRLGKSWEDLWDNEYINERKEKLKVSFTGANNPRYIDFQVTDKISILNLIANNYNFNLKDSKLLTGFSEFKVRELIRSVGIENMQSFKKLHKNDWSEKIHSLITSIATEGLDLTDHLGIIKWEPEPEFRSADAKGTFPSFIPKSDQERIQNIYRNVEELLKTQSWEVTEKIDGQSHTTYLYNGEFGVCSRNLELKDTEGNTFWNTARKYNLEEKLRNYGRNIMIQGEQCGPGIQGNSYKLDEYKLFVYDVFLIDEQRYLTADERMDFCNELELDHVPIEVFGWMNFAGHDLDSMLKWADGMSDVTSGVAREGLVFKMISNERASFKVVSNSWLMNEK